MSGKRTGVYFNNVELPSAIHPLQDSPRNQACRTGNTCKSKVFGRPLPFAPKLLDARSTSSLLLLSRLRKRQLPTDVKNTIAKKQRVDESPKGHSEKEVHAPSVVNQDEIAPGVTGMDSSAEESVVLEAAVALAKLKR